MPMANSGNVKSQYSARRARPLNWAYLRRGSNIRFIATPPQVVVETRYGRNATRASALARQASAGF